MDINGVWASLNFPSMITGFCGRVFSQAKDPELGLATTRAWNDWFFDEWYSPHPERMIPMGITWLADAEIGAEEIRRNAARGFRSVTLPERPHRIGFPSIFSDYWEPIIAGVRGDRHRDQPARRLVRAWPTTPTGAPPLSLGATLFGQLSLTACAEWLWSAWAVRYPERQDRDVGGRHRLGRDAHRPPRQHHRPFGLRPGRLRRPAPGRRPARATSGSARSTTRRRSTRATRSASTTSCWRPTTPTATARGPTPRRSSRSSGATCRSSELRKLTHQNAAKLYRHPLPDVCLP